MFSHVFVGSDDVAVSKKFYDAVLGAIGVPEGKLIRRVGSSIAPRPAFSESSKPIDGNAATHANGGTIGFACESADKVKAFHNAGVAMVERASRIRPVGAKAVRSNSISPICAILWQQDLRLAPELTRNVEAREVGIGQRGFFYSLRPRLRVRRSRLGCESYCGGSLRLLAIRRILLSMPTTLRSGSSCV